MRTALRAALGGLAAVALLAGAGAGTAAAQQQEQPAQLQLRQCDSTAVYQHPDSRDSTVLPITRISDINRQYDCTMGENIIGPAPQPASPVALLQRTLNDCYGFSLPVDGIYGPQLRQAVMRVQDAHGLRPDGVYAPPTRDVMRWITTNAYGDTVCATLPPWR
jgi:murein L,D-transpeptidase YcbB/YkuD